MAAILARATVCTSHIELSKREINFGDICINSTKTATIQGVPDRDESLRKQGAFQEGMHMAWLGHIRTACACSVWGRWGACYNTCTGGHRLQQNKAHLRLSWSHVPYLVSCSTQPVSSSSSYRYRH